MITARLVARTACHIGTGEGNDLADGLIRRDGQGVPCIPGTALAGALRTLLTRLAPRIAGGEPCAVLTGSGRACSCAVCRLLGGVNPDNQPAAQPNPAVTASRLLIFNAVLVGDYSCPVVRDGVGIERVADTAARFAAAKYDLEVLPAGAAFALRLELRDCQEEEETLLAAALAEWQEGRLWLGASVARGLGAFCLDDLQYKSWALDDPDGLMQFLKCDRPWLLAECREGWLEQKLASINVLPWREGDGSSAVARSWFSFTGTLKAPGPLVVNDPLSAASSGFDQAPLLERWGDWRRPVLSGAGLRGVLRAHAERLARTLLTLQCSNAREFLDKCPACDPNVRGEPSASPLPLESCDSLLQKRREGVEAGPGEGLCLACCLFGSTRLGSRLRVEDAPYVLTNDQEKPVYKMLDFLAIDRFTGGGADGAKFDALVLWRPDFLFRLHLENPSPWELGWLWLVLRDLQDGLLAVGAGSAKGMGRVVLHNWQIKLGYLDDSDWPGQGEPFGQPDRSGVYETRTINSQTPERQELFKGWLDAFRQKVDQFIRPAALRLEEDTYWGKRDQIYTLVRSGK